MAGPEVLRPAMRACASAILAVLAIVSRVEPAPTGASDLANDGLWAGLGPPARAQHMVVYDSLADRLILFGGINGSREFRDEVWTLRLGASPSWRELRPDNPGPGGLILMSAIFDPLRNRVLYFGGHNGYLGRGDLWSLSLTDPPHWDRIFTGSAPYLTGHRAIYDPARDRMIIFGEEPSFARVFFLSFYELRLDVPSTWTPLVSVNAGPDPRFLPTVVHDPVRDRMLVFGGAHYDVQYKYVYDDLWSYSYATKAWTWLSPAGAAPPRMYDAGGVFDPIHDRLVIAFGVGAGVGANDPIGGSWALPLGTDGPWESIVAPDSALMRGSVGMVFDSRRSEPVVHGGSLSNYVITPETWALRGGADGESWVRIQPPGPWPLPRKSHSMIYDAAGDQLVMFGGSVFGHDAYPGTSHHPDNDLWAMDLTVDEPLWSPMGALGTPPSPREGHSAIYDAPRRRMVLYGGSSGVNFFYDAWSLTLDGPAEWERISVSPVVLRSNQSAIYDPVQQRMILFGGYDGSSLRNDLWALSLTGTKDWTHLSPAGTPPSPRERASTIYDPLGHRMIVWGGANAGSEVHALSLDSTLAWTQLATVGTAPPPALGAGAIYDSDARRMVIYASHVNENDDVWSLDLGSPAVWTRLHPERRGPGDLTLVSAVYDPLRRRMLLFGSAYASSTNETWSLNWDATTPTQASLVSVEAEPRSVRLVWSIDGADPVTVYRADSRSERALGDVLPDGARRVRFEDKAVVPGAQYVYSLGLAGDATGPRVGKVTVEVPTQQQLALLGPAPSPVQGDMMVRFTLAGDAPATLELFDLSGRRLTRRPVAEADGGAIRLARRGELASGIYFVRLTQSGRSVGQRIPVVH